MVFKLFPIYPDYYYVDFGRLDFCVFPVIAMCLAEMVKIENVAFCDILNLSE